MVASISGCLFKPYFWRFILVPDLRRLIATTSVNSTVSFDAKDMVGLHSQWRVRCHEWDVVRVMLPCPWQ